MKCYSLHFIISVALYQVPNVSQELNIHDLKEHIIRIIYMNTTK